MARDRFEFGRNWEFYSKRVDEDRIARAVEHLKESFGCDSMEGKTFLDVGSGSGLFSVAACRLGAEVTAFDFDDKSVATSERMLEVFAPSATYRVMRGDATSAQFIESLPDFDFVYSWGVLHHTGEMWKSLRLLSALVRRGKSRWVLALYNDAGRTSTRWHLLKRIYVSQPWLRPMLIVWTYVEFWLFHQMKAASKGQNPLASWKQYSETSRGMSPFRDIVDWAGGLPYEFVSVDELLAFAEEQNLVSLLLVQRDGIGNNEFRLQG